MYNNHVNTSSDHLTLKGTNTFCISVLVCLTWGSHEVMLCPGTETERRRRCTLLTPFLKKSVIFSTLLLNLLHTLAWIRTENRACTQGIVHMRCLEQLGIQCPAQRAPRQCSGGELSPLQLPVHTPYRLLSSLPQHQPPPPLFFFLFSCFSVRRRNYSNKFLTTRTNLESTEPETQIFGPFWKWH